MPIATPAQYREMLVKASAGRYAFAAVNVTNMETARAALTGFVSQRSDGIIQISIGGANYASGQINNSRLGAIVLAEYIHRLAAELDVYIALHTDHCPPANLDNFLRPLIAETAQRRARNLPNLFNSHMFDGSTIPLSENIEIARSLLLEMRDLDLLLEVECGVVGGEEDGLDATGTPNEKLYTTPADMLSVYEQLSPINEIFLLAATFGNVHGVYQPGSVKLNPAILLAGQQALAEKYPGARLFLVFHGGSGSELADIQETLAYGVIKMNIDTDAQYAYTRPIADHILKNYQDVLKIDGEVGNKRAYDPRTYLRLGEEGMAARIAQTCRELRSANQTLYR